MNKATKVETPDVVRVDPPEPWPDPPPMKLAAAALAYKNAAQARATAGTELERIRKQCTDAEREVADADIEVGRLKQALTRAALE